MTSPHAHAPSHCFRFPFQSLSYFDSEKMKKEKGTIDCVCWLDVAVKPVRARVPQG